MKNLLSATLLFGLGCLAGAAQAGTGIGSLSVPLPASALPVPPPPPQADQQETLQAYAPAPVPDPDLQRPAADVADGKPHTEVVPNLFNEADKRNGQGYLSGSAAPYDPNPRPRPSPSLNLRVPLQ